jgi:hypothetical protein
MSKKWFVLMEFIINHAVEEKRKERLKSNNSVCLSDEAKRKAKSYAERMSKKYKVDIYAVDYYLICEERYTSKRLSHAS